MATESKSLSEKLMVSKALGNCKRKVAVRVEFQMEETLSELLTLGFVRIAGV